MLFQIIVELCRATAAEDTLACGFFLELKFERLHIVYVVESGSTQRPNLDNGLSIPQQLDRVMSHVRNHHLLIDIYPRRY